MVKQKKILKNAIDLHYLRPDNALWVYSIYKSVNKYLKKFTNKKYKSLDLGCGDGTTCYLATGGEISEKFDVFLGTKFKDENLASNAKRFFYGFAKRCEGRHI